MKILIIDERQGQEFTPEIEELIDSADIHLTIHMDNKVVVHTNEGVLLFEAADGHNDPVDLEAEYVALPHRDDLSGEASAKKFDALEERRAQADVGAEPALEKAKRALAPTQ